MENGTIQREHEMIQAVKDRGPLTKLCTYTRLSGPGWLQSAITLGGGSLATGMYLGIQGGMGALWVQPLAMILGVVMLCAIGYVTLATGQRPFRMINRHVNPVLGWGWIIATLFSNLVFILPQFALVNAAMRQNLLPGVFGPEAMSDLSAKIIIVGAMAVVSVIIVWSYGSSSLGIKVFEAILKITVAVIVLAFFGVIIKMSASGALDWGSVLRGYIPNLRMVTSPVKTFQAYLAKVDPEFRDFWVDLIVKRQRDMMISSAAVAVGINMTFLLPYSLLKRGWNKDFTGLAFFDLIAGMFIPFMLVTSCVVMAAAARFHTVPVQGLLGEVDAAGAPIHAPAKLEKDFRANALARLKFEVGDEQLSGLKEEEITQRIQALPLADRRMAAMLVKRDAFDLAESLEPLTGSTIAHYVFGLGVVGMGISTAVIIMLINGFVLCEILDVDQHGWAFRIGTLMPCLSGMLGPFFWKQAAFYLAVPTAIAGMTVLPIAYLTFFFLMNQKRMLGSAMPRGRARLVWNVLMLAAVSIVSLASIWSVWSKARWKGIAAVIAFLLLAVIVHLVRGKHPAPPETAGD